MESALHQKVWIFQKLHQTALNRERHPSGFSSLTSQLSRSCRAVHNCRISAFVLLNSDKLGQLRSLKKEKKNSVYPPLNQKLCTLDISIAVHSK